jgi:hypothetical protein
MFGDVSEVDELDGVAVELELVLVLVVDGRDELLVALLLPDEPDELDGEFERLSPPRSSSRER